jgi:group I intron endonuclease
MNTYTIYRATNIITGLHYIGFTSMGINKRSAGHKRDALNKASQKKFHKAIREHGWESFIWEIIYQAKEELPPKESHTCKVMEDHFINEHDSLNNGYNSAPGGGSWPILKGEDHPLYNVGHSDVAKQRIKDNHHDVSGTNNPKYNSTKYTFKNSNTHEIANLTQSELIKIKGLEQSAASRLISGKIKTSKGWQLVK